MRSFLQKTTTAQHTNSAKLTTPGQVRFGQSRDVNTIFHLQRSIGNQAVLRMLQTSTEEPEVELTNAWPSPRSGFDFSRIPVHSKSQANVQAKAAVSSSGDIYEQEADGVAEQVMRIPEPQQPRPEQERTQARPVGSGDLGHAEVPPIVHEVLSSPGQPLDAATRAFFEPRFRHDFGGVRLHTDAVAEQSAHGLNAHAYTVGHDIVFGVGRYAPGTHEGRRLLAHELTHVVQQGAFGQVEPAFIDRPVDRIQCKPAPDVGAARKDEARLAELAKDPLEAHLAWAKLSTEERLVVLRKMAVRYGASFADQFHKVAKRGRPQFNVTTWQPHSGPTPERLKAKGWRFLGMENTGAPDIDVEVWVNPSGNTIRRDVSTHPWRKEEPPIVEPPETTLREKFEDIKKQFWKALASYDTNVERLESNPPGADRELIEADISKSRNTARGLITKLAELRVQSRDAGDEDLENEISDEWADASQQYWDIGQRYNGIH